MVTDNNGSSSLSNQSPCSSKSCANGIRFSWAAGTCYQGQRFAPIAIVWTVNQKLPANSWPHSVPCSTGIQLWWNGHNQLTKAAWVGSQIPPTSGGLAACFKSAHTCNAGHCVTAGCLPAHVNGADIFLQGGDSLTGAQWLLNGRVLGAASLGVGSNDVYWYGYTPPASPFATASTGATSRTYSVNPPAVTVLGRTARDLPAQMVSTAPSNVNGVDFSWYLPLYESGTSRGCHTVDGSTWTSPPLEFAYTTGGQLNSRVTVPTCPTDSNGSPLTFNNVDFSWRASTNGATDTVYSAAASWDSSSLDGCQKVTGGANAHPASLAPTKNTPVTLPASALPQPPSGTDGIVFTFGHDDFKSSCWTSDGNVLGSPLQVPGHPRLGQWQG
ncbi:MAG TPA: hypothetical protein VG815_00190 [Chloroflexota bacterium]|nr:hypothetical protein [Chloroflexota bacterium]